MITLLPLNLDEAPVTKKPQPYNKNWTKDLTTDQLNKLAGPRYKKPVKQQGVAEAEGEYKVYYMTAEDHKLMGRYTSREEAEQRLNQLQSKYPDNKFIIWTNSKQGVTEEQIEETELDPVRRIEELFRNK